MSKKYTKEEFSQIIQKMSEALSTAEYNIGEVRNYVPSNDRINLMLKIECDHIKTAHPGYWISSSFNEHFIEQEKYDEMETENTRLKDTIINLQNDILELEKQLEEIKKQKEETDDY